MATLVAGVILWSVSGHVLWNVARQACYTYVHHVKQERSFRDTLVLHNDVFNDAGKLVWIKKDEIRYLGRMFDIKKQIKNGEVTVLVGHYDDVEHYLYKYLAKLFDDEQRPLQKQNKHWHQLVALIPGSIEEKVVARIPGDGFTVYWISKFHYYMNKRPPHAPPDFC